MNISNLMFRFNERYYDCGLQGLEPVSGEKGKFVGIDYAISVEVHAGGFVTIVSQPVVKKKGRSSICYGVAVSEIAVEGF